MGNRIARFEVTAINLRGACDFYRSMFGWEMGSDRPDRYRVAETGGGIPGFFLKAEAGAPTFVSVSVEVDDIEKALARVEELGGTIYVPAGPSPLEGERSFAIFGDPEGNLIGLVERDEP